MKLTVDGKWHTLLPCTCKGEPKVTIKDDAEGQPPQYRIQCCKCSGRTYYYPTLLEAIADWNEACRDLKKKKR